MNKKGQKNKKNIWRKIIYTFSAIEMFYRQLVAFKDLPFSAKIPNTKTLESMQQIEKRKGISFKTVAELFEDLKN